VAVKKKFPVPAGIAGSSCPNARHYWLGSYVASIRAIPFQPLCTPQGMVVHRPYKIESEDLSQQRKT